MSVLDASVRIEIIRFEGNPTKICGIYVLMVGSSGFAAPSVDKSTLQVLNVEKKQQLYDSSNMETMILLHYCTTYFNGNNTLISNLSQYILLVQYKMNI